MRLSNSSPTEVKNADTDDMRRMQNAIAATVSTIAAAVPPAKNPINLSSAAGLATEAANTERLEKKEDMP